MLCVLNSETAISDTVQLLSILVIIENCCIGAIAYRMYINLQPIFVGVDNVLLHRRRNLGPRQTCRIRSVEVWIKKPCGRRTQAAIGKSFQTADPKHGVSKGVMHTGPFPAFVIGER